MRGKLIKHMAVMLAAVLALAACDSGKKEQPKKEQQKTVSAKKEAKLAEEFTDKTYPFCNSTNLYTMPSNEQKEGDEISFTQYGLKGNNRKEIVIHGNANAWENLISVNDQWIYYEYYPKNKPAVCRIPITKKDGCDVIDPSLEEILFYPEKRTKEEKAQGVTEKYLSLEGDYWVTSKYILYFVGLDYEENDDYVDELVRYDLETGETVAKVFEREDLVDNSMGICISRDESRIVYGEDAINVLDVEKMEVHKLAGSNPDSYAMSPDGSMFAYTKDSYEFEEDEASRVYLYSLAQGDFLTVASSHDIRKAVCQAEGIVSQNILHLSNGILGCYREKIYMRYLVEYRQGEDCVAHYGVISMPLSEEGELSFEKEFTQMVRQESAENKGQWKKYHTYTKKERKKAKKAGIKLQKKVDEQHQVTVNFGNPQRVIGNQLFCRSVNVDMNRNHWFCINLDTGDKEKIDREDARYRWILCEDMGGWGYYGSDYFSDDFLCLENEDEIEVVWEEGVLKGKEEDEAAGTVQEQLRYLAEHRYDWMDGVGAYEGESSYYDEIPMGASLGTLNYNSGLQYMVADLNQNGRLEMISLDMAGSGKFTNIWGYEVPDKSNRQGQYIREESGDYQIPDIGTAEKADVYYDKGKDRYWYAGADYGHVSATENWTDICLWSIDGKGKFRSRYYGTMIFGEGDKITQYYLAGKKVTKKAFVRKKKNMEPGMKKKKATFGWMLDGENLVEMSDEELLERLTESWNKFSVK